ncbi:MAG: hypothetical protein AB7F64_06570 [Gammaproteobacteria bacterium]
MKNSGVSAFDDEKGLLQDDDKQLLAMLVQRSLNGDKNAQDLLMATLSRRDARRSEGLLDNANDEEDSSENNSDHEASSSTIVETEETKQVKLLIKAINDALVQYPKDPSWLTTFPQDITPSLLNTYREPISSNKNPTFNLVLEDFFKKILPYLDANKSEGFCTYLFNQLKAYPSLVEKLNDLWFYPRGIMLVLDPQTDYTNSNSTYAYGIAFKAIQALSSPAYENAVLPLAPNNVNTYNYFVSCVAEAAKNYITWYAGRTATDGFHLIGFWNTHDIDGTDRVLKLFNDLQHSSDLENVLEKIVDYFCHDSFGARTRFNNHSFCSFLFNSLKNVRDKRNDAKVTMLCELNSNWFQPRGFDLDQLLKDVDYTKPSNR